MTDEPMRVDCEKHGPGRIAAVVCRHLVRAPLADQIFVENSSVENDRQAWCGACEERFEEEGELNEAFREFNDFRLVCDACYETIRAGCREVR